MNPSPSQPVALVTGGARGIGRAITDALVGAGWAVTVADVDQAGLARLDDHPHIFPLHVDVRDEGQVRAAVESTLERADGLDLVVNDAGRAQPETGPVEELALETWQDFLDTNLTGAFLVSKHTIPALRSRRGTIVNVASTRAEMSEPNTEAYAATKGGLLALTHALAVSLGPDIAVHAVSPGWIDTRRYDHRVDEIEPFGKSAHQQHPAGRVGRPEDVAQLVLFLTTEAARFMTGQNHVLDGGMTKKMIYRA